MLNGSTMWKNSYMQHNVHDGYMYNTTKMILISLFMCHIQLDTYESLLGWFPCNLDTTQKQYGNVVI
jgi:hypothetical protein